MKTTNDYLDELTEKKKLKNDAALAKFLNIAPGQISNYRSKKRVMDDTMCANIADALEIEPWGIITAANRERATSESAKKRWEKIQLRFQQTATLGLLMFVTSIVTPSPAEAAPVHKQIIQHCILC